MAAIDNLNLVRRFFLEAMNQNRYELMDGMFSPDYTLNGTPLPTEGTKGWAKELRKTNPNMHFHLQDIFAVDNKVTVWWILRDLNPDGTPPTFNNVAIPGASTRAPTTWSGINILTFDAEGRVLSNWEGEMNPVSIPQEITQEGYEAAGEAGA